MNTTSTIIASYSSGLPRTIRIVTLFLLGSVTLLWLAAGPANAQTGAPPLSDRVTVSVNGMLPPLVDFRLDESQEGTLYTIPVPRTIIELTEPGTTTQIISDRLIIDPYEIVFQSDPPGAVGGPGRPDAVKVPEDFSPISLRFGSDVGDPNSGPLSDFVDVFIGGGAIPIHFDIVETPTTEPPITFIGGPYIFDMLEADGTLSDTLDIPQFSFSFVSDGEDVGLPPLDPLPGDALFSFPEEGPDGVGQVFAYDVLASSDTDVPEPASIALAALALVGLARFVRRR